ncbi:MAG: hypothetical protein WCH40_11660 [Verrucomicrobiales bacterium]
MQAPDPIESALARLMPIAMSASGQRSIEEMLDELAAGSKVVRVRDWRRLLVGLGIAAAVAALVTLPGLLQNGAEIVSSPQVRADVASLGRVHLVEQSERVESMSDEGWVADSDGAAMQAVRLRMVSEDTVRDEETGYMVKVSEPRNEILLMPVTAF